MTDAIAVLKSAAIQTEYNGNAWMTLVHAAQHLDANAKPGHAWYVPNGFTVDMIEGIKWQEERNLRTKSGKYRVAITWVLDRYRVSVWRRVQEPEKMIEVRHPLFARTAVETANMLLRKYNRFA